MTIKNLPIPSLFRSGLLAYTVGIAFFSSGCATYYQQNIAFHQAVEAQDYSNAINHLDKDGSINKDRNRLLYHLEKGAVLHMANDYAGSNESFEKAYIFIEDFMRNYGLEAFSFITNPSIVPYPGEDFERVQIHYFKALNFAMSGNLPDALVECRRINIKLLDINDRYEAGQKNHYSADAFAWNLMGILFDAGEEYNNAFICFRNALEAYESSYTRDYGLSAPEQLIIDLLTSAHRAGMHDELEFYRKTYGPEWSYVKNPSDSGELVVFWNNGLGPIKTEDSVNFFLDRGAGGVVSFVNEENNFWLPIPASGKETHSFKGLQFIRLALPRYVERTPLYFACHISVNNSTYKLEKAQDINKIALLNLHDRMGRELAHALLRVAIKFGIEQAVKKQDEAAGAVVSIINALTENADTRNWQTLPHEIHYARFSLPDGTHDLVFSRSTSDGHYHDTHQSIEVHAGRISFMTLFDPQSLTNLY